MKKILVSFVAIMAAASSAMAAETMNMHDQVNNAQAPAHQMQSSAEKSAIQGDSMTMMDMSSHDQAAMSHDMMQNSNSAAHQDMAEMHKKMMKAKPGATNETAKSFSEMSEHEKAAAVHEKANNGQSSVVHQQQADKHRSQITRINPQLHLLDPHLTPKSLAYAPVRERFFSHISNFNSEEVEVSDQHCHVTPDNYKNTFFLL